MTVPTFPTLPGLTYPLTRTPMWDTVREDALSGKRTRYPNRNLPTYQYELQFDFLREDQAFLEWQTLLGFYNSMYGDTYMFQFNDPSDSSATNEQFGTGDGATTIFQLTRMANFGFAEPVFCPTAATIKVATVTKVLNTDYTIDLTTGLVTFLGGHVPTAGQAITWTGSFNWYCRFEDPKLDFQNFMKNFWDLKKVTISTEIL